VKAIAIVDGEHYPDVVRDALAELPYEFVGVMLIGGTEKLRGEPDYGVPIVEDPGDASVAVDLSDEPVLDPQTRLALASRFLALGFFDKVASCLASEKNCARWQFFEIKPSG